MNKDAGMLPSRQFVLVALAIFIAGGAIVAAIKLKPEPTPRASVVTTNRPNTRYEIDAADTDGDGLKDWEEALWGTSPGLTDTDGDGVLDGDENIISYNPTETRDVSTSPREPNTTDALARDLLSQYVFQKSGGGTLTTENVELLTSNYIQNFSATIGKGHSYTQNDLTISPETSSSALRAYGNTLGALFTTYTGGFESELVLFAEAISAQSAGNLSKLESLAKGYLGLAVAMQKISVPESAVSTHLTLMNSLLKTGGELLALARAKDDPVLALAAFNAYRIDAEARDRALIALVSFFTNEGIVFAPSESGYRFSS